MDKLPSEILDKVFIQLDLTERMECMLVCRKWWRVLDEYSLLYNITIDDNFRMFNRFKTMAKGLPHRAAQVQQFILIGISEYDCDVIELYHLIPNARVIKLAWREEDMNSIDSYIPFNEPKTMAHSNSNIEVLADYLHCKLTSYILTSNLCGNLRELSLVLWTDPDTEQTVLSQLRNLPLLQKLTLRDLKVGIKDLEMIHTNIPSIQDLQLKNGSISASEMPSDIVPVTTLRNFSIDIYKMHDPDTHSQLYQYMNGKYKNATNIDCVDPALACLDSDELEQIYQNGVLDFLRMIGQKQNKLTLCHMPDNLDVFAELDALNAEIEELKIWDCNNKQLFYYLYQSNQSNFIQKLDIHNSKLDFGDNIKTMTSLNTVNINIEDYGELATLNLVDCLNAFPASVTKFSTSSYALRADGFTTRQSHIEILDISCIELNQSLAKTISSCFPKLKELTLSGSIEENMDITLNHPHLKSVKITTTNWGSCAFLFTCGSRTEYYLCHHDNKWMKVEVRQASFSEIETISVLSISTFADKKLDFSNGMIEIRS